MRLLCPFCQKAITVADTEAGKPVNCPLCQQLFAAPYLHVATPTPAHTPAPEPSVPPEVPISPTQSTTVNPLAAPYGLESTTPPIPTPTVETAPPPTSVRTERPIAPQPSEMVGYQRTWMLTLNPELIRWLPAIAFGLILLLSLFSWVGMYPAGYSAYTQNAWQCLFAGLSEDRVAEDELKKGAELRDVLKSNWWLLPYLVMLLPALILATAGPVLALVKPSLPPIVEKLLPYRAALLAVLAVFTMLALAAQWSRGFGLEHAVQTKLDAKYEEKKNAANTPDKEQRYEMTYAAELGSYHLQTTTWLRLAFLLHIVAAFAVAIEAGLQLRGNKPIPRIALMW